MSNEILAGVVVQECLCEIWSAYGPELIDDPRRLGALLKDYCGEHKLQINLLTTAMKEKVVSDLSDPARSVSYGALRTRLVQRLYNTQAIEARWGSWTVDTWALALGKIDSSEYATLTCRPFQQQSETDILDGPPIVMSPIEQLREAIRLAYEDQLFTPEETNDLKALSRSLNIPSKVANQLLREVIAESK